MRRLVAGGGGGGAGRRRLRGIRLIGFRCDRRPTHLEGKRLVDSLARRPMRTTDRRLVSCSSSSFHNEKRPPRSSAAV